MKYFLDTEFIEGTQEKRVLGFKVKTKPTIDLISIGIVCEDNREYYAISKDFNLKEAWNRYDIKTSHITFGLEYKVYWLRDNVLKPIYKELHDKENLYAKQALHRANVYIPETKFDFTYKNLKKLINKYGKTNKQIAEEVKQFCLPTKGFLRDKYELKNGILDKNWDFTKMNTYEKQFNKEYESSKHPEFYAYYADYDWVAFCWLFGKMIDLPKGFPMYCIDLKQVLETKTEELEQTITDLKTYPKQTNKHNALSDALYCKHLYNFLNTL